MEQFLDTFGLGHLKNDFTKHNIDSTDLLRFMSQDQIRQIIPNIGDQIRFQRGIREIAVETQVICETEDQVEVPIELSAKKQKVDESDVDNKSDSTVTDLDNSECGLNSSFLSIASSSEPLIAQLNIKSILEADFIGKAILRKHEKCSSIDNRDRNNISEIIVTYFLNRAYKLNNTSLKAIASKIVDVFPTENKNTYFVSPVPKRKSLENKPIVAKGKLVDKQRNKLTALRRSLEFQERGGESVLPETFNDAVSAAAKDGQLWLRSNSEPHEDVLKYWEQSYPIRKLASNKTKTIEIFYTEWPILGTQIAIELINFDFEKQFKQNKIDITCIFQDFFDDILELKRKNLSGADETFLNLSAGDITRDSKTAIQLYLLAALIPPKGRCRVAGKHWKPSVAECRDGFLLYVKAPGDIDEARAKRIDLMYKKGLTVQPYLLIVGPDVSNISSSYVVINSYIYKTNTVLDALDLCFKVYHVLDARYPFECQHIWYLIQNRVYKLQTKSDIRIPFIADCMQDIP